MLQIANALLVYGVIFAGRYFLAPKREVLVWLDRNTEPARTKMKVLKANKHPMEEDLEELSCNMTKLLQRCSSLAIKIQVPMRKIPPQ